MRPPPITMTEQHFCHLFVDAQKHTAENETVRRAALRANGAYPDSISDDYEAIHACAGSMILEMYPEWAADALGPDGATDAYIEEVSSLAGILVTTAGLPWIDGFICDRASLKREMFDGAPPILRIGPGGFVRVDQ